MDFDDYIECFDPASCLWLVVAAAAGLGALVMQHATRRFQQVAARFGAPLSHCGLTGQAAARRLLDASGLQNVAVSGGAKLEHYHPRRREIGFTDAAFHSPTLYALAAAAHEVGHALQFAEGILLCRLRQVFWPVCNVMLIAAIALPLAGLFNAVEWASPFVTGGVVTAFVVAVLLQLPVHLPLERDATRRAGELVRRMGLIDAKEQAAFDHVLRAAWKTHLAMEVQRFVLVAAVGAIAAMLPSVFGDWDDNVLPFETLAAMPAESPPQAMPRQPEPPAIDPCPPAGYVPPDDVGFSAVVFLVEQGIWIIALFAVVVVLSKKRQPKPPRRSPEEQAIGRSNEGVAAFERGDLAAAAAAYTDALSLHPQLSSARYNRGMAYLHLGQVDAALADFAATLAAAPHFADALVARGQAWLLKEDFDAALSDFDAALTHLPDEASRERAAAQHLRGQAWMAKSETAKAIADFDAAIAGNRTLAHAFRDRGLARHLQGQHQRAVEDASEALQLNPADALAYNNRGAALLKLGQYARARADLTEAIRLEPHKIPNAYKHLAWLEATCPDAAQRDAESALANAIKALQLSDGKQLAWLETLAAAYAEAGNFDLAIDWQRKCAGELPADQAKDARLRLRLYEARQPYREQPQAQSRITGAV